MRKDIKMGEVWYVKFPLEEDHTKTLPRPAIVLDVDTLKVLSVKVTKTEPRKNDNYDTPIVYWEYAKLRYKSTARIAKIMLLNKNQFMKKIGDLHTDDLKTIQTKFIEFVSENSNN